MSGAMKLTVIGSGTGALTADRGPSGYILEVQGEVALIDGGSGTLRQCARAGYSYKDIDRVFYSHLHPDHTIDMVPLLFATKYTPGFERTRPLSFYGPVGFKSFFNQYVRLFNEEIIRGEYELSVEEITERDLSIGRLTVKSAAMAHTENAIGYRFEYENKSLVYSGDTDVCDGIIDLASEADLLILECSFPDDQKIMGHLTPTEAGQIASLAGAKRLVLTHLYPPVDENKIKQTAQKQFAGDITIAFDLLTLEI